MIIITVISIFTLSFLVWLANRFLPFKICPICAGVSGTWIWLIIGYFLGYQINLIIPAILMGGSVVGLAYQLEKKLPAESTSWHESLLWKTLFIPAGFVLTYSILTKEWLISSVVIVFLLGISFLFLSSSSKSDSNKEIIKKLKQKMDKCC
ncbi:MAG: hypothetical protein M1338_02110 [Patescibacteria group bacterium]|nr:hypothetical protein [Patescibacteria group bacterium]